MAEAGAVGIGRVTLSRRERLVMVEPRDAGMVAITLRASEEVRAAAFAKADTDIDADMVAIAETIIKRRSGHFDPATFRDRYQEALRELIEAKMKGLPVTPVACCRRDRINDCPRIVAEQALGQRGVIRPTAPTAVGGEELRQLQRSLLAESDQINGLAPRRPFLGAPGLPPFGRPRLAADRPHIPSRSDPNTRTPC